MTVGAVKGIIRLLSSDGVTQLEERIVGGKGGIPPRGAKAMFTNDPKTVELDIDTRKSLRPSPFELGWKQLETGLSSNIWNIENMLEKSSEYIKPWHIKY